MKEKGVKGVAKLLTKRYKSSRKVSRAAHARRETTPLAA